jgi:hypothetical protein
VKEKGNNYGLAFPKRGYGLKYVFLNALGAKTLLLKQNTIENTNNHTLIKRGHKILVVRVLNQTCSIQPMGHSLP